MKTRLGIVGPKDSVDLICGIAEEFNDRIISIPFTYANVEETAEIIRDRENLVDVWLFSGQAPYAIANEAPLRLKGFFPQLNGSSLTKVLLDISYKDHKKLDHLSFDTIPANEIYETFSELHLPVDGLQLFPYAGYKPTDELTSFHYNLYKNDRVKACVTCIHSVYEELKSLRVPVYRITPTKMIIRQMIIQACQQNETVHFKKSQIAVLIIQINEMNKLIGENTISYKGHRSNLKLQEFVIDFTEAMSGSFVLLGNGKFMIFSTRGSFEKYNKYHTTSFLDKITVMTESTANIGIGYGTTSLGAEQNAYLALNHARNQGGNSTILVDEDRSIEGPLQKSNSITYSYRTDNKEINNYLTKAGVNISTFNKIQYVQNNLGHNSISAANIAEWLNMTQRNARRILTNLEKQSLAEVVGEETPTTRGRPRKIYRVGIISTSGQESEQN